MIYVNCPEISHENESNKMKFNQIYDSKIDILIVDHSSSSSLLTKQIGQGNIAHKQ